MNFYTLKILAWNIGGILGQTTRRALKDILNQISLDIVILLEPQSLFIHSHTFLLQLGFTPICIQDAYSFWLFPSIPCF